MFIKTKKASQSVENSINERSRLITEQILREEGLAVSESTIKDLALFRFGSQDKNHANAIETLYANPRCDLRNAVLSVVSAYWNHNRRDIDRVPILLAWMADILEGIEWAVEDHYQGPASLDPATPEYGLSELYETLMNYDESVVAIDRFWANENNREYLKRNAAIPGEEPTPLSASCITDNHTYNLAKSGWFRERALDVKKKLEAHEMTPSEALQTLIKYWEYYSAPCFRNVCNRIKYIVLCSAEFPDTPELRKEFRRIVCLMSQ